MSAISWIHEATLPPPATWYHTVLRHVGADRAHPDQEPDAMSTATNIGGVTAQPVSRLIDEFSRLPGIGPKTAQKIIADRKKNGPYADLAAMMRVRGIGQKTVYINLQ